MSKPNGILCIGEILWDSIPAGLFIGGAPFNVAGNLKSLEEPVTMISRIGSDELGRQVRRQLAGFKMSDAFVQLDDTYPTGIVNVDLHRPDNPGYDIVAPAAWDFISFEKNVASLLKSSNMLVFGTLAQRGQRSRETIRQAAAGGLLNVYDINLRPPYVDEGIVRESMTLADIVKFNDDELLQLQRWFALPGAVDEALVQLAEHFACETICMTRGGKGAVLWHNQQLSDHGGYNVTVRNTIGAGDAFLAGMLYSIRRGWTNDKILDFANATGAFVASRDGAIPKLDLQYIQSMTAAQ